VRWKVEGKIEVEGRIKSGIKSKRDNGIKSRIDFGKWE